MTKIVKYAMAAAAVAALAACTPGATIPGVTPGTTTGGNAALIATCTNADPAATPTTGAAKHGRYSAQRLPNGWDNLADEMKVTEAIKKIETEQKDWACFNKFYPGAITVYSSIK